MKGDAEAGIPLAALIEGLSRPEASGLAAGATVSVVQTHASVVFLTPDRAWKVKKPVRFWDLLDYGTLEARRRWCEAEVRLNRRLAPEIYLGVVPVVQRDGALFFGGPGEVVEHAVEMRRFDEADTLRAKLARGEGDFETIEDVARMIAAFHRANRLDLEKAHDAVETFAGVLQRNFDGTPLRSNAILPAAPHAGLRRRLTDLSETLSVPMEARVAAGHLVDGHGDIRLDHVIASEGRWTIVDCVEFSAALRHIDPASDMAFLSMDLRVTGYPALARELEAAYTEAAEEHDMAPLLPLFRAYRAYVRATVDYHASLERELEEVASVRADGARAHFALAWTESFGGTHPSIVVMRGPSGSGKSHLAGRIAPLLDAEVIRSDVVRKALLGMAPTDRPEADEVASVYGRDASRRTYAALLEQAREVVSAGRTALLDATYLLREPRDEVQSLAFELSVPMCIVDIDCPREVVEERLAARRARGDDASDADLAVYLAQLDEAEPLGPDEELRVVSYDAVSSPMPMLMDLVTCLEGQL